MIEFVKISEGRMKILKSSPNLKKMLENVAGCKLEFNDEIAFETEDPIMNIRIKSVLTAFGRGFEMNDSMNLLDEDFYLEAIDVRDYAGKSRSRQQTLKGRVIGKDGETKKLIEKYAEVKIAIYGKTISILGRWEGVRIAKKAIEMLLSGSMHSTIYRFLSEHKK